MQFNPRRTRGGVGATPPPDGFSRMAGERVGIES